LSCNKTTRWVEVYRLSQVSGWILVKQNHERIFTDESRTE
jgi:hypothetical protein